MNPNNIKLFKKSIAVTTLSVGSLIIGNRYYSTYNCNKDENIHKFMKDNHQVKQDQNENDNIPLKSFTIDRLIDGDCNGKTLTIGINGHNNPDNSLSYQGIRWGQDGQIKRLVSFSKTDDGLIYNFEDNYKLTLNKINNKIIYSFEYENNLVVKEMPNIIIKSWKPISLTSTEFDKITELK